MRINDLRSIDCTRSGKWDSDKLTVIELHFRFSNRIEKLKLERAMSPRIVAEELKRFAARLEMRADEDEE